MLQLCSLVSRVAVAFVAGEDDILAHNPTAGLLRPAYAIVKDTTTRQVILCVRGTHSRQDMFTSLTGGLQLAGQRCDSGHGTCGTAVDDLPAALW
jgi:hypothetical protein